MEKNKDFPLGAGRNKKTRVKSAKGRRSSSTHWLHRQLNDPYVLSARGAGFRSRAAWKLIQLDEKAQFLSHNARIVDLGAAPGGWSQVLSNRIKSGKIVAIDVLEKEFFSFSEYETQINLSLYIISKSPPCPAL